MERVCIGVFGKRIHKGFVAHRKQRGDGMLTDTCAGRITKGREQIVNKTFVKMLEELGYDVELTYRKKTAE